MDSERGGSGMACSPVARPVAVLRAARKTHALIVRNKLVVMGIGTVKKPAVSETSFRP